MVWRKVEKERQIAGSTKKKGEKWKTEEPTDRIIYPTWKGSKVPWTEKSTTPFEDCNILRCLNASRALSWLSSTVWFVGNALSKVRLAGDPPANAANIKTEITKAAPIVSYISWLFFLLYITYVRVNVYMYVCVCECVRKKRKGNWNWDLRH